MISDNVIQLRADLERDYVSTALSAVIAGTVKASDLTAICPVEYLVTSQPLTIYSAMAELEANGQKVGITLLLQHIIAKRETEKGVNPIYRKFDMTAADIAEYAVSIYAEYPEAVMDMAQRVASEAKKRDAENKLLALISQCQQYGNDTGEIANACTAIAESLETSSMDIPRNLSELMARAIANAENGEQSKPLPTPWPSLNRVLKGGMVPGELVILAARPGMGKTALAGCIAVESARAGKPVLFISREVKDLTIANRLIAREGKIDQTAFRQYLDRAPNLMDKIRESGSKLSSLPMTVVEKSVAPMTPREVRRLSKSIPGIGLIVVDYLQLLCPDTKSNSREREVAEMSRSMKQLALDCDCPVLLLSQLNRSSEMRDGRPQLSDLRESGAIEQDADIVMFLHAPKVQKELAHMQVDAIVAKGRSSGTGLAKLKFLKPYSDFIEDDGTLSDASVYQQPKGNCF